MGGSRQAAIRSRVSAGSITSSRPPPVPASTALASSYAAVRLPTLELGHSLLRIFDAASSLSEV
jgi:hypothetical protein